MIFLFAFTLTVVSALGICADIVKAFFCESRLGSGGPIRFVLSEHGIRPDVFARNDLLGFLSTRWQNTI